ncbi:MAG: GNAT family N-acetyltransferase [Pseudomonadota bacterium]|nr:GNAT family N-acetyltransferase [Pseudomonadota bacterium]
MSDQAKLEVKVLDGVSRLREADWDALVGEGSPFLEHVFLATLEDAGSVGEGTGWVPCPVTVWRGGKLVGAAPAYMKGHSYGEFVYDWQWAAFAKRSGIPYYPKLIVGAPFTPVTGERLLVAPGEDASVRAALLAGLRSLGQQAGGLHVLFPTAGESEWLESRGGMLRLQWQYHWENQGFRTFEDFLATLPTKRRTAIRKERKSVTGLRIVASENPDPALGPWMWRLYRDTHLRHTGAEGYLDERFFELLFQRWGHRLHTVLAYDGTSDGARPIAGTLNVRKGARLYGRHWGALPGAGQAEVPFLHFEVAIYAAVDWCIANGVSVFEPGHGGEHKRARGFTPRLTSSIHWLTDPRLVAALRDFCQREAAAVRSAIDPG